MIKIRTFSGEYFEVKSVPGQSAAQLVYLSGLFEAPALCNGIGRCGLCRLRFVRENDTLELDSGLRQSENAAPAPDELDLQILGPKAIEQGWRLGCRHAALPGQTLELPPEIRTVRKHRLNRQGLHDSANGYSTGSAPDTAPDTEPDIALDTEPGMALSSESSITPGSLTDTMSGTMALDFGSTSIHALFLDNSGSNQPCDSQASTIQASHTLVTPNPQLGAGSDIMSRLAFAANPAGREQLRRLSQSAIQRLLDEAAAQRPPSKIMTDTNHLDNPWPDCREVVLAANSAMVYLVLGKDPAGLSRSPYHLDYLGGQIEELPGLPPIWVSPLISPFIGGDISAGFAFLSMNPNFKAEYPFVLADLGTNGELLLALDEHTALAASLPLGPALEGSGMRNGAEARPEHDKYWDDTTLKDTRPGIGVITGFSLTPQGLTPVTLPLNAVPQGISGTGYISLLHNLRKLNLLDSNGQFISSASPPNPYASANLSAASRTSASPLSALARKLGKNLTRLPSGEPYWPICGNIGLSAGDVEELLKIKAAFSLGLKLLLKKAGIQLRPGDKGKVTNVGGLEAVYLAGALGRHIETAALTGLGFVPENFGSRIRPVGNTSLAGAAMLAASPEKYALREKLCRWAEGVKTLNLAADPEFYRMFAEKMNFR